MLFHFRCALPDRVASEAKKTLAKYMVSGADADIIADAVGDAFAAHYSGDENPDEKRVLCYTPRFKGLLY